MIVAREQVQHNYGIPREEKRKRPSPGRGRRFSRRSRMVFTGLVALAFINGVIISFYYAQVFITSYRIHSLQKQLVLLQEETSVMYSDLAKLQSLDRIEKVAVNKLGMVKPDGDRVVKVAVNIDTKKSPAPQEKEEKTPAARREQQGIHSTGQEQNWVIQAFSNLVEKVKEGLPSR